MLVFAAIAAAVIRPAIGASTGAAAVQVHPVLTPRVAAIAACPATASAFPVSPTGVAPEATPFAVRLAETAPLVPPTFLCAAVFPQPVAYIASGIACFVARDRRELNRVNAFGRRGGRVEPIDRLGVRWRNRHYRNQSRHGNEGLHDRLNDQ